MGDSVAALHEADESARPAILEPWNSSSCLDVPENIWKSAYGTCAKAAGYSVPTMANMPLR